MLRKCKGFSKEEENVKVSPKAATKVNETTKKCPLSTRPKRKILRIKIP